MAKILLAEDDLTSRTILTATLKKWGYDTIVTSDGRAAWEALQKLDEPMLVILDWHMPDMNGLEVCRRIRERDTSLPPYIIILTIRGETADIVKGLEAGANDYVSKPYNNEELHARIEVGLRMLKLQVDLQEANNALTHLAMHDPLTGILNRRAILNALDKELARARRQATVVWVGLCDLDHFKQVNDRYGHQAGDEVLCEFVRTVQSNLREYDLIGRYGGEEFLVVASTPQGCEEGKLYERLHARIAGSEIVTKKGRISITVSIGVAASTGADTVNDLLAAADSALYQAKEGGRNRVVYADH